MKFEDYPISQKIKTSLAKLDLRRPTDIQYKAIPHILRGEDVLAISQTGTGKTLAFTIPILHKLSLQKRRSKNPSCLVMVPTHELAEQIARVFQQIGASLNYKTMALIGGVDQEPQIEALKQGVQVIVATPGRMFDLASQGHLVLDQIKILVLDEADKMLDYGFLKDIQDLTRKLPSKRQTLFFSATINKKIKSLSYSLVNNAIRIQISPKDPVTKNLRHAVLKCSMDDKRFYLEKLFNNNPNSKLLVFVRTRLRAERVQKAMERQEITCRAIHGEKSQNERDTILKDFNNNVYSMLIATDLSARGIDFQNVDIVVNYDLPDHPETYVHRIGRTGRGKNKGLAISFVAPKESELLQNIEDFIQYPVHQLEFSKSQYKDIMDLKYDSSKDIDDIVEQIEFIEDKKRKKNKYKK